MTCTRLLRPVIEFAYEIHLLCVSDLLRTYTTCALEMTYAYNVRLLRVSDLLRMLYVFLLSRRLMLQDLNVRLCDDWDRVNRAVTERIL